MNPARIYQRPKNATQSGRAGTDRWILEFESSRGKHADSLMGWAGGADTIEQVRLHFPTLEAAKAYAGKYGIPTHIVPAPVRKLKLQAYADNFR